ncbi:hypothetical protein D3C76_1646290 [compost metagenome]
MAGKQEGCDNDQQDPFEGFVDAGKRGADGHWGSFVYIKSQSLTGKPRPQESAKNLWERGLAWAALRR